MDLLEPAARSSTDLGVHTQRARPALSTPADLLHSTLAGAGQLPHLQFGAAALGRLAPAQRLGQLTLPPALQQRAARASALATVWEFLAAVGQACPVGRGQASRLGLVIGERLELLALVCADDADGAEALLRQLWALPNDSQQQVILAAMTCEAHLLWAPRRRRRLP